MNQLQRLAYVLVMLFCPSVVFSAINSDSTLCHDFEETYFSCKIDRKIISICASGNISPDTGYVQYRYGTTERLELQFPSKPLPPKGRLKISEISEGNVQYTHLKFRLNGFNYVLYQGFPSGVYIKRNEETVFNKTCEQDGYERLSPRAFRGIETVSPQDGVDR